MAGEKDIQEEISEDELDQIIQDMSKDDAEVDATVPTEAEPAPTLAVAPAPAPTPTPATNVNAAKQSLDLVQSKKKVTTTPTLAANGQQALTLEMNGVVNLKLCFKNGDRSIEVVCSEEALTCTMADGTEFRIPTGNFSKSKKVA